MSSSTFDRIKGCLYGAFIADALAAPTHWFYGGFQQVNQLYGHSIRGYVKPISKLPGSIMSKSNTGGGGRGSFKGSIIGDVIAQGKKQYWAPNSDYHYHNLLAAGENTLEIILMRRVMRSMVDNNLVYNAKDVLNDYITFMKSGNYNDTYIGTCHRMFFANLVNGKPPADCPDDDGHNVDTIDSLVTPIAVIVGAPTMKKALKNAKTLIKSTRIAPSSENYASILTSILWGIIENKKNVQEAILSACKEHGIDARGVIQDATGGGSDPLTACYVDSAFSAVLHMAVKYEDQFEAGVLANANRGGENCGSGAVIGAILGASCGYEALPTSLKDGLLLSQKDKDMVDLFVKKALQAQVKEMNHDEL